MGEIFNFLYYILKKTQWVKFDVAALYFWFACELLTPPLLTNRYGGYESYHRTIRGPLPPFTEFKLFVFIIHLRIVCVCPCDVLTVEICACITACVQKFR